jgi:hypothetical protein
MHATGNWSHFQLSDLTLASPQNIPCTSFACVKDCSDDVYNPFNVTWAPATGPTSYTDCALKCPGVSFDFLTAAASSSTKGPSLVTYGQSTSTWLYKSDMPLPVCTLTPSSKTGVVSNMATETVGGATSSTESVASPTKTSDTVRIGGRDLSCSLGVVV